jgi:trigger factor
MDSNADDLALVEKTIETIKDIATSITANSAIGPKPDPEQAAGTTNEQLPPSEPELAIAHQTYVEDVVAAAPKKKRKAPVRQAPPKKSAAKKSSKKSPKKSAKKTKSSAGRKAAGKTAKKVAKKKKTKKSKR